MPSEAKTTPVRCITFESRPQTGRFGFSVVELVTPDALIDAYDEVRSRPNAKGSVRFEVFDYFTGSWHPVRPSRTRRIRIWKIQVKISPVRCPYDALRSKNDACSMQNVRISAADRQIQTQRVRLSYPRCINRCLRRSPIPAEC